MDEQQFQQIALPIGLGFLIGYMGFIMWKLAQDSKAGRYGTFIIFLVLGLGIFSFIIKQVLKLVLI